MYPFSREGDPGTNSSGARRLSRRERQLFLEITDELAQNDAHFRPADDGDTGNPLLTRRSALARRSQRTPCQVLVVGLFVMVGGSVGGAVGWPTAGATIYVVMAGVVLCLIGLVLAALPPSARTR